MDAIYGYFTDAQQTEPAHDPGVEVDCPVCHHRLSRPMKTISVMVQGDARSYFYRTHKACYEGLTDGEAEDIDGLIIDAVIAGQALVEIWHPRFPSEAHNLKLWQPEFEDDEYLEN